MLILTRNLQEGLVIDGSVTITLLSTKGNQVKLGVEAPKDVKVHREEVLREHTKKRMVTREEVV